MDTRSVFATVETAAERTDVVDATGFAKFESPPWHPLIYGSLNVSPVARSFGCGRKKCEKCPKQNSAHG